VRVLVLGAAARWRARSWRRPPRIIRCGGGPAPNSTSVDERAVVRTLAETRPEWVVNAAAYTAVDLAEDQPAQAIAVNDTAVGVLAWQPRNAGCRLVHLSTDFVFDGNSNRAYLPADPTNPLSVYG